MREVTDLHRSAMAKADQAELAKRQGDFDGHRAQLRSALEDELCAARLVESERELEPTRSVLHRSAASLALECGEFRLAEQVIAAGLAGDPPEEVADELRDLLEDVYFRRHLAVRGAELQPGEFQMSLEGDAVGFGIARSDEFVGRVRDIETIIYRTAERRIGREYRDAGRRKKSLSEALELYVSVPRAASLAVTFRLGQGDQMRLPGVDLSSEVVTDFLDCISLLNSGDIEALRERIPEDPYFRNFVGLAQKIAPDGDSVRTVGFTTSSPRGDQREVAMRRAKAEIRESIRPAARIEPVPAPEPPLEIRGVLLEADATSQRHGRIEVVSDDGQRHRIEVPRGMMSDIVKPLFEEPVVVQVSRTGGTVLLESIDLAEDSRNSPDHDTDPE